MKIVETSWNFEEDISGTEILKKLERAGRTCYKSEDKITDESAIKFVDMLVNNYKHESVIEHASVSVRVICDRGISHEIIRHRLGSYSQESTRYCNYSKNKFGKEITVVKPKHLENKDPDDNFFWVTCMRRAQEDYFNALDRGWTPQEARGILPTEVKTEIVITYNLRQWRHFFKMRCGKSAHPQLRAVTISMLKGFREYIPVIFDDFIILWDDVKKEYYAIQE